MGQKYFFLDKIYQIVVYIQQVVEFNSAFDIPEFGMEVYRG
jgi:hypothetical protein